MGLNASGEHVSVACEVLVRPMIIVEQTLLFEKAVQIGSNEDPLVPDIEDQEMKTLLEQSAAAYKYFASNILSCIGLAFIH